MNKNSNIAPSSVDRMTFGELKNSVANSMAKRELFAFSIPGEGG